MRNEGVRGGGPRGSGEALPGSASGKQAQTRERLNYGAISLVAIVGLAIASFGIVENVAWKWTGIWQYAFLDVGSATALAAALAVVQRSFVRAVRDEGVSTRAAFEQRASQLESRMSEQATRLEDVEERLAGIRSQRRAATERSVDAARNDLSAKSLMHAIAKAHELKALAPRIRVRAADELDGMRLIVEPMADGRILTQPALRFTCADVGESYPRRRAVLWGVTETFDTFAHRLMGTLEAENLETERPHFNLALALETLTNTIDLAIASREGRLPHRFGAPLVEVIDDDWVITVDAIEERSGAHTVPYTSLYGQPRKAQPVEKLDVPPPATVDAGRWAVILRAAHAGIAPPPRRKGFAATM
jgi:hypothetical protein